MEEVDEELEGTEPKISTLPLEAGLGVGAIGLAVGTIGLAVGIGALGAGFPPGTTIFPLQPGHKTVLPARDFITRLALPQFEQATNIVSGLLDDGLFDDVFGAADAPEAGFGTELVGATGAAGPVATGTSLSV